VRLQVETYSGFPADPETGICYYAVLAGHPEVQWCTPFVNFPLSAGKAEMHVNRPPWYVVAGIQPNTEETNCRYPDDHAYLNYQHILTLQWLNPYNPFVHWPRHFPSKKADAVPADLSWLTTWTPTGEYVYAPFTPPPGGPAEWGAPLDFSPTCEG
jgi:hypothetical protein